MDSSSSFPQQQQQQQLSRSKRLSLYHPSLLPLLRCRSLRHVSQVHCHVIVTSLLSDPFASSRLLKAAIPYSLRHALLLFDSLPNADSFSLNTLLSSLPPQQTLPFFFSNITKVPPNSYSFPPLLSAAARIGSLSDGEVVHCQCVKRGLSSSVVHVSNSLVHMYAQCGVVTAARNVFDEMPVRDLVSWNALLTGFLGVGDVVAAREVFDTMPERNVVSWNVMVGGYLRRRGEIGEGLRLVREMGVKGSVVTVTTVAAGCGRGRRLREGRAVHGYFLRNFSEGEEENLVVGTALVDMYGKCGRLEVARRVFDRMRERNLVTWNAMLLGYCIRGRPEDGLALFREMLLEGIF